MSAAGSDGADAGLPEHSTNQDEWDELGNPEQRDTLVEAMQDRSVGDDDAASGPEWDDVDDETQADTLAAIEQSLGETWTAEAFAGAEDTTTIPVEMYQLSESQQEDVLERIRLIAQVEQAGEQTGAQTAEELEAELGDEADDVFENLNEVETWMNDFLGDATTGSAFTADWWENGDYPAGMRIALLMIVFNRYEQRIEAAQSFRPEQRGGGPR